MRITSETLGPGEAFTVLIDGEDVSDCCFLADDELGEVHIWKPAVLSEDENLFGPETEVRHGAVEIRPRRLVKRRRSVTEWIWSKTSRP